VDLCLKQDLDETIGEEALTISGFRQSVASVLPKGRFTRSVTLLTGGAALGQAINILVSPVLTRLYSPEDFGAFGVYVAILGIALAVASLRYEYAILLPKDDESAANILALCFLILIGMTTLSWFAVYGWGDQMMAWANVPELGHYLWFIPIGMLGAGTYQILNYWAIRMGYFARIGKTRLTRGLARASLQVGLGFTTTGPMGLLLGQLAGDSAGSGSLGTIAWRKDYTSLRAINLQSMRKAAVRYRRFAIFSGVANIIDVLGSSAPQILFSAFYGSEVAGWFMLGQSVIAAPLNIVVDSVSQVYFGEIARLGRYDPKSMRQIYLKLTGRLALIGAIPVAVICTFAPWAFSVIFGQGWEIAGVYVQILGLMFAVRFAVIPLQHTLNALERQDLLLIWEITRFIVVLGALLAGNIWHIAHTTAVMIYSLSMSASYIVLWLIAFYAIGNGLGRGCERV
jgi:O-antigen/teichoic acid export membrane protein